MSGLRDEAEIALSVAHAEVSDERRDRSRVLNVDRYSLADAERVIGKSTSECGSARTENDTLV